MDLSVKPGENFYEYAAGNWMKTHPLDAEHPLNGAFVDLEELNKKRIREMVGLCKEATEARYSSTEDCLYLQPLYG